MSDLPKTSFSHNGRDYTTTLLPALEGLVIMPKIIVLFGREITSLILVTPEPKLRELLGDMEVLGGFLHTISKNAADNNGLLLLHEILRYTTCKQIQLANSVVEASVYDNFSTHFAGEYMDLFTVAILAARASFTKPSSAK